MYLAQDIGLPLGYGFGWYIHGPYSPDLTSVAYQVVPEGIDSIGHVELTPRYKGMIDKVNKLEYSSHHKQIMGNVQWYELLASIAYMFRAGNETKDAVARAVNDAKPHFSEELVKEAYDIYMDFKNSSSQCVLH